MMRFTFLLGAVLVAASAAAVASGEQQLPPKPGNSATRAKRFRGQNSVEHMLAHRGGALRKHLEAVEGGEEDETQQYWFQNAVLDNFVPTNEQQPWYGGLGQRYFVNNKFYKEGGPIFVYIGGEGPESAHHLSDTMFIYDLAEQYGGAMLDLEHRFYGESYPTRDMSNHNLQYLTSQQALADLSRFITWYKDQHGMQDNKVITIGGSYPGALSGWFRLKYPHITHGSIASSAPVEAETNFVGYMEVVGHSLTYFGGQECYDAVAGAANDFQNLVNKGELGIKQIEKDFMTCGSIHGTKDLATLESVLMGNIQGTVQYNNEQSGAMTINDVCEAMLQSDDYYANFVELSATYMDENGETCNDQSYLGFLAYLSNPVFDGQQSYRQWYYQTCNEFGYFQTTDSANQPFHAWTDLSLDYYTDICTRVYDFVMLPNTYFTNNYYGSTDVAGTNIAFPDGTIDPWHALSVNNETVFAQDTEVSVFIEGTAHCADLYAPHASDPDSLKAAHEQLNDLVAQWLE